VRNPIARTIPTCCAVAAAALLPAAAASAAPVAVGAGNYPRVAVDAAGNGHVTWIESIGNTDTFHYCKIPAGGTACTSPFAYADGNQDVDGGYALLPGDGRILLLEARGVTPGRAKLLWTSTDGGASFSGPTQVGTLSSSGANIAGEALYAPAGTLGLGSEAIFTIGAIAGVVAGFQATDTTTNTTTEAELAPNVGTSLGLQGNTLVAALGDFSSLNWSQYVGPVPAPLDSLNTAANWSAPAAVGPRSPANIETVLASGPAGIHLGYEADASAAQANFVVSRFTGSGWTAPAVIAAGAAHPDLFQDPSGRLHAIWKNGFNAELLYRYATSAANTAWTSPQLIDATAGDSYAFPQVATNAAGNGWAVWAGVGGIRAARVAPAAPAPPLYSGPTKPTRATGYGATFTLTTPRQCVSPGQRFRVTLKWRRQKRKGNLFVKVRRSDFYLDRDRVKIDPKAPFVYTFKVLVAQRPGSTITVRARAFIKVKRGKTPTKSIRTRIPVCR
jgi:hypothetical protein